MSARRRRDREPDREPDPGEERAGRPFRAGGRGAVVVRLAAEERELLADLLADLAGLLEPDPAAPAAAATTPAAAAAAAEPGDRDGARDGDWAWWEASLQLTTPQDPAVARLLPDGHREDGELARGYRRLTEAGLREHKQVAARTASQALRRQAPVTLDAAEARSLLTSLTDARLVLAERLGVRSEEDSAALHETMRQLQRDPATVPDDDPALLAWLRAVAIFETLAWWQEDLLAALG